MLYMTANHKVQNENKEVKESSKALVVALDHTAERYIEHLFYRAIEARGGVDEVIEDVFQPREYNSLDEVLEIIDDSEVERDEEAYGFAKLYLGDQNDL